MVKMDKHQHRLERAYLGKVIMVVGDIGIIIHTPKK
tara:strand:+ start:357 stop:464 length:108 start_codon:yes stop_codon:yes gene_type:complete